jgi:hypothetical protein
MKCDLLGINHSTGSMIDVNQRLENDIPGADQVLLNAAEQVHFTSIPFTRGSRQAINAAGSSIKEHRIQHIHGYCYYHKRATYFGIYTRNDRRESGRNDSVRWGLPRPSASQ